MRISQCGTDDAVEIAQVYNMAVSGIPHCYPVSAEDFRAILEKKGGPVLEGEYFLVAREGQIPIGFADFGIAHLGEEAIGVIRFLWYRPGKRQAGQRLLEEIEGTMHARLEKIVAFPQEYRYPFYHLPHAYLSGFLGNVHGLLGINGYRRSRGEIYMDMERIEIALPRRPQVEVDIEFNIFDSKPLPRIHAYAIHGGRDIGSCKNICCGEVATDPGGGPWLFTHSLNVETAFQGKGVGRYLLGRTLQRAKALGYRHASISTDWNNYRALLFYTNMGYRVVDWTFELTKDRLRD